MGLYYMPFWLEIWWKDYRVQALPRTTRLIFYDFLFLLWDRDMQLDNNDNAISHYLRITPEEWLDAKRILLKHDLIQAIQANRKLTCHRLGIEYDRVMYEGTKRSEKAKKAARARWEKQNQIK